MAAGLEPATNGLAVRRSHPHRVFQTKKAYRPAPPHSISCDSVANGDIGGRVEIVSPETKNDYKHGWVDNYRTAVLVNPVMLDLSVPA